MRALGAIEEVLVFIILHLRGRDVRVRVGHVGLFAEMGGAEGVPLVHKDGGRCRGEDVAFVREFVSYDRVIGVQEGRKVGERGKSTRSPGEG